MLDTSTRCYCQGQLVAFFVQNYIHTVVVVVVAVAAAVVFSEFVCSMSGRGQRRTVMLPRQT